MSTDVDIDVDSGGASDEAVRRLREESRLRIEGDRRWRTFFAWCAVATMAGGISLGALGAEDAREAADEARAVEAREVASAEASAAAAALAAIERARAGQLRRERERREIEALQAERQAQREAFEAAHPMRPAKKQRPRRIICRKFPPASSLNPPSVPALLPTDIVAQSALPLHALAPRAPPRALEKCTMIRTNTTRRLARSRSWVRVPRRRSGRSPWAMRCFNARSSRP